MELHDLISPSSFHHRGTRRMLGFHPYVVDILRVSTKPIASTFTWTAAKEWNSLVYLYVFVSLINLSIDLRIT